MDWRYVWEQRKLDPAHGSTLAQLMAADGLDTSFSGVSDTAWAASVRARAQELGIVAGTSVFEVGCGAGAFLYPLAELGARVSGIDRSAALVEIAGSVLHGDFAVAEAIALDPDAPADVVVSCGVFMYFESLDYAAEVVRRMVAKATRAVAILDVPDRAREAAALAERVALAGGEAAYAERYAGLDHRYYDRDWLAGVLRDAGLRDVVVTDQDVAGYGNSAYRFNVGGQR